MAQSTESSIRIDADPGTVLDVIADVESYPEWTGGVTAVTVLAYDDLGWVDEAEFTLDAGPIKDTYVLKYEWDVDEAGVGVASWSLVRANVLSAMDGTYTLREDAGGTLVTYRLSVDLKIPMLGMLKRKAEQTIVGAALEGLKKRAEA